MNSLAYNPARSARHQRGDVLLIVLIFLLVCLMGLVVSMRGSIVTTQMVGNNLQRHKDVQIADVALKQVESLMAANSLATGQPLELSVNAGTQPAWWRDVNPGTAAPTDAYWDSCATTNAADATLRCASLNVTSNGAAASTGAGQTYKVLAVVQRTGRADANNCNIAPYTQANYYDIYLRVLETSGVTSSTTETVYRLCTRT